MKLDSIEIDQKYSVKFGNSGDFKSLGWGSENSQLTRFRILCEIPGFIPTDSMLDVGCGHGDFSQLSDNYHGIDLRDSVIEIARGKFPNKVFNCQSIFETEIDYDWIFGSGIFGFDREDWTENAQSVITEMFKKSRKGVGVNFLSILSTGQKDKEMKYSSPDEICLLASKISNKFVLRHDYRPNDMTLYIMR